VLEDAAKVDIVEDAQQFVPAGQDARLLNHENARRSFQNIGHSESSHHDGTAVYGFLRYPSIRHLTVFISTNGGLAFHRMADLLFAGSMGYTCAMTTYKKRIADEEIALCLKAAGAVLIEGPKWCGKTWSARHASASEFDVADSANGFRNREIARLNPAAVLDGQCPRLIDEWQEVPSLWDAVRNEIDRKGAKGAFILTGSSTPDDRLFVHSGVGRFCRIRLQTMSLYERGLSTGRVSVADLLRGKCPHGNGACAGALDNAGVAGAVCFGGWPGLLGSEARAARRVLDSYLLTVAESDMSRVDGVRRDPQKVTALIASLARNTATPVKKTTLLKDIAQFSSQSITEDTIGEYMNLLARMFLLVSVPAWDPPLKSTVRLRTSPKRMLADMSLAAAALGADETALVNDPKTLGSLFEGMALHDLSVYGAPAQAGLAYYADNAGLEIDAILSKKDGTWCAFEMKLGCHQEDDAAENLLRLKRKLADSRQPPPACLAVITGVGSFLHVRKDGVMVIPIDHLGP
jgi:predicted AAA+ superfamily ATPase